MAKDSRVFRAGVVVVAAIAVGALPPVRRQLARLLLWTTGTVVRTQLPEREVRR